MVLGADISRGAAAALSGRGGDQQLAAAEAESEAQVGGRGPGRLEARLGLSGALLSRGYRGAAQVSSLSPSPAPGAHECRCRLESNTLLLWGRQTGGSQQGLIPCCSGTWHPSPWALGPGNLEVNSLSPPNLTLTSAATRSTTECS